MYKRIELDPKIILVPGRPGTRSENQINIIVPSLHKETFRRSISYQGPMIWNSLPLYVKASNNIASFKRNQKKFLYDSFCQDGFV